MGKSTVHSPQSAAGQECDPAFAALPSSYFFDETGRRGEAGTGSVGDSSFDSATGGTPTLPGSARQMTKGLSLNKGEYRWIKVDKASFEKFWDGRLASERCEFRVFESGGGMDDGRWKDGKGGQIRSGRIRVGQTSYVIQSE